MESGKTPPNRLRELRVGTHLTLAEAVEKLGIPGLDKSQLSRYERGEVQVPDDRKAAFALFYGVSREWLMRWESDGQNGDNGDLEATG